MVSTNSQQFLLYNFSIINVYHKDSLLFFESTYSIFKYKKTELDVQSLDKMQLIEDAEVQFSQQSLFTLHSEENSEYITIYYFASSMQCIFSKIKTSDLLELLQPFKKTLLS